MKYIILLLFPFFAFAQNEPRLVEISHEWPVKKVMASDGLVYKYNLPTDSARRFDGGNDEYEVTVSFKKIGGVDPVPDPVTETIDGFNMAYTGWSNNSVISDPTRTPGWYKNTISYSTTGEARYTFTGTGVELWGERLPSHGTGTVTVGTETKTVFWNGTDTDGDGIIQESEKVKEKQLPAKIVEFKGLQRGEHTIIVKPISGYVLIDYLVITK